MRSRFRRVPERVFRVELTVHRLDSIPALHRLLYVQWRARRAVPCDGRTPSKPVQSGNVVRWDTAATFTLSVPADPADPTVLQPAPLQLQLRSERRARWVGMSYQQEGVVNVDLSEVAAVGYLSRNYLVQESLLNTTLKLSIRVTHVSGDKIFRTRTLPQVTSATLVKSSTPSTPTPPAAAAAADGATALLPEDVDAPHVEHAATAHERPVPLLSSIPSAALPPSSAASAAASSASIFAHDPDPAFFDGPSTPSSVLHNSIPNPEVAQRAVYEQIFQQRLRDSWPDHIVASRVDAAEIVNQVYLSVCAADGIGVAPALRRSPQRRARSDVDDEDDAPQAGPVTQMLLTRKPSGRSPHLSVRSSSMGELAELSRLSK